MRAPALARLTLAALVVATFLAIFYAQQLKGRPRLLLWPNPGVEPFQPVGPFMSPPVTRFAHFRVKASVGDTLEVSIVGARSGRTVRVYTLRVREYRHRSLSWDGRDANAALEPPGSYDIRVRFVHAGQTVVAPLTLVLLGPSR